MEKQLASLTFSPFLLSISFLSSDMLLHLRREYFCHLKTPLIIRKWGYHRYYFEITKLFKPNLLLILCNKHNRFLLIISESLSSLNNSWWLRIIPESTPSSERSRHGPGLHLLRDQQDGQDKPEYDWGCEDFFVSTHPNPNLMSVHMNCDSFCANLS